MCEFLGEGGGAVRYVCTIAVLYLRMKTHKLTVCKPCRESGPPRMPSNFCDQLMIM